MRDRGAATLTPLDQGGNEIDRTITQRIRQGVMKEDGLSMTAKNTKAPEGAVAGVGAGGAIGGTLGLLAGIGALAIPGLGPFIAAGPIMAALSGAAAGAAVGGITGALVGMGIPEIEAKQYEGKIRGGNILLSIHVEDGEERERAKKILERHGAVDVVTVGEESVPHKAAVHHRHA